MNELHEYLMVMGVATEEEISLVTCINGYNIESLESILYTRTGYRSLDQVTTI